mmetsp:Transcript_2739/g.4683  ORF Transcript_2739/g.4683 Transcript_2739/m.4683 type:complete len:220 (-) Transcript_2739:487-1146(-)
MTWPTLSMTTILNLPCMWAMVSSLSILSLPASSSCLGILSPRKVLVRSLNHCVQYCLLASRSVRQTQSSFPLASAFLMTWAGIDTLAESTFLTVPLLTPYLTTDWTSGNLEGLEETMLSMKGRASMADPSTTSIINRPLMWSIQPSSLWWVVMNSMVLVAMEPPIECPTRMRDCVGNLLITCLRTFIVSPIRVCWLMSLSFSQKWDPWPLKSKETTVEL